eukprot:767597-Hanusia_phi.AAC.5
MVDYMEVNGAVKLLKYSKEQKKPMTDFQGQHELAKKLGLVSSEHNLMFFDSTAKPAVDSQPEEPSVGERNEALQNRLNEVYCWIVASIFLINVLFVGMIFVLSPKMYSDTCY